MPEYLDDPSVLTKDKLKSELLANNVELPSGNPTKDVYVQLYLKNLTAQNNKRATATTLDAFSSDEELPMPVVSNRSRSSGRKATRKTDKVQAEELDVTMLSDLALKEELLKHGVDAGPIVASTRKLYEKKLKKLLDDGPVQPELVLTEIQVNYNGNSESDLYSDKEDEVTSEPVAEPVVEPEPAPVVEKSVRSRGKIPVSTSTRSSQHHTRHQLMDAKDHDEDPVLQPKRRSRNSWHALKVPEDLRPGLTEHVQPHSTRKVSLKPERLARADSPCASSRPVQEPAIEPLRAATRNCSEEQCLGGASKPSRITRVDLVTFSPMCNISPIKRHGSLWSLSDQSRSKPAGVSAAGVEKIAASDQTPKEADNVVLKKLFPNDINSPTGITATCRRPIKGAADRPVKSSDLWSNENVLFSPKTTKTSSSSSSYTESRTINRVTSLPPTAHLKSSTSTSCFSTSSVRPVSAAPPAAQTKVVTQSTSLWIKLFLLAIVGAFLFLVYQAMETNTINPFPDPDAVGVASESKA